jgi:hypothetical protein
LAFLPQTLLDVAHQPLVRVFVPTRNRIEALLFLDPVRDVLDVALEELRRPVGVDEAHRLVELLFDRG